MSSQLKSYRRALKNIILTDYLEFCRDIEPEKSDGLLAPNKEKWP